jgi:2-polyprenyl-6-methoxyphenol hydroxylase-like FAD-dependent oxidoreductase
VHVRRVEDLHVKPTPSVDYTTRPAGAARGRLVSPGWCIVAGAHCAAGCDGGRLPAGRDRTSLRTDQPTMAYQRFYVAGPMALLPLVASDAPTRRPGGTAGRGAADTPMSRRSCSNGRARLARRACATLGGGRSIAGTVAQRRSTAPRIVLLGNAAQALHPWPGRVSP